LIVIEFVLAPIPGGAYEEPFKRFKGGGSIAPQAPHKTIRLDSQQVTIRMKGTSYEVDAVFELFNTGDTMTEWIGFPRGIPDTSSPLTSPAVEGWVNGAPTKFDEDNYHSEEVAFPRYMGEGGPWLVDRVTFPGHARTTIRVKYEVSYDGRDEAIYFYGTGSLWKDNIGKSVFIMDSSAIGGRVIIGPPWVREPGPTSIISVNGHSTPRTDLARYEETDFKPQPDAYFAIRRYSTYGPVYVKAKYPRNPKDGSFPMPPIPPMPNKLFKPPDDK